MRLSDVEAQILPGDVFLFRGRLLHSRIIQRWTRSVYSHVGIAHRPTSCGMPSLDVLEAMEGRGVRTFPLRRYLERRKRIDWWTISDPRIDRCAVVRWLWDRRGNDYASPRQFVRSFVTIPLLESLGLPTKVDANRPFCSWIAAEALVAGGYRPEDADFHDPALAAPGDVALFTCLQRKGMIEL